MKTIKLTEAAMLSAFFIVSSVLAIGTGIGYSIYLSFIVPIIVTLIYNRCGLKYGSLACIITLILILFTLGDLAAVLYMIQGVFLGGICAIVINSKKNIYDDLFYASILSCFAIMITDVALTPVVGMSIVQEFQETANMCKEMFASYGMATSQITDIVVYICIAAVPIGTVIIAYFGVLLVGRKLNELSDSARKKSSIIINFKKLGGYLCCSNQTILIGSVFIIIVNIMLYMNIKIPNNYLNIIFMASYIITIYFILRDSLSFIAKTIYKVTKSNLAFYGFEILTIVLLVNYFKVTLSILIVLNIVLDKKLRYREKQIKYVELNI